MRILRFAWYALRAVRFLWAWCALPPLARASVLEMLSSIQASSWRLWVDHYAPEVTGREKLTPAQWRMLTSENTPGVEFLYRSMGATGAADVLYGDM